MLLPQSANPAALKEAARNPRLIPPLSPKESNVPWAVPEKMAYLPGLLELGELTNCGVHPQK
jgi:hypothetical protein